MRSSLMRASLETRATDFDKSFRALRDTSRLIWVNVGRAKYFIRRRKWSFLCANVDYGTHEYLPTYVIFVLFDEIIIPKKFETAKIFFIL